MTTLLSRLRCFRADTSGNIALLFAIAAIPLFAAAGLALDYAFAARERTDLQNAIDAATISLAKLPQNTTEEVLKARAIDFIHAMMPNAVSTDFDVTVTKAKGTLTITADAVYPTLMVKVLNLLTGGTEYSQMDIGTSSTAQWGSGKVEVVLVLDNTGSMDDGTPKKIELLKQAATSLVNTLAAQAVDADTVKIALVPFSSTVRLPTKYQTSSWMDSAGKSTIAKEIFNGTTKVDRFDLFSKLKTSWGGCVENRPAPYDVTDPAPTSATPATLIVPFFAPDEPDDTHTTGSGKNQKTVASYNNSYLTDGVAADKTWQEKQGATAKYATTPLKTLGSSYGPNVGCGLREIVPLTTDLTETGPIRKGITNMLSTGFTNIPMGLAWGWYALSPNDMLTDNKPYDDTDTAKVIVLLSDGKNQFEGSDSSDLNGSAYSGVGYAWQDRLGTTSVGSMPSKANARLKTLCTNINAVKKGTTTKRAIDVYTVLVEESDTATSTLMKNCASQTEMFYNVQSSANLVSVFNNIAGSIGKLHLSR